MAYASIDDLGKVGIRSEALAPISPATKQAALDATAEEMDSYFRAEFKLIDGVPGWQTFTDWGQDVIRANAILAVWDLMVIRGYNPAAGADATLRMRYEDTIAWLRGVARQQIHPNITPKMHETPGFNQPRVLTAAKRGW